MPEEKLHDLPYLNALNRVSALGPVRIETLVKHFGSARAAWEAPQRAIAQIFEMRGIEDLVSQQKETIDPLSEWNRLSEAGVQCLARYSDAYPSLLQQMPVPPPLLYCRGRMVVFDRPAVAIVGSRRCTFYGREVAERLAEGLADHGVTVVSGMALGVDTAAHRGSLQRGGDTIAVLGCGLDRCYPPANSNLMAQIAAAGLLISEFPLGSEPLANHFPRRNRIISGLSAGTVVVEATAKSGALITAHYALEQNREVFAVPGNIGSPYSRGCHRLLKEGARLVESVDDILEELKIGFTDGEQLGLFDEAANLSTDEKRILDIVPYNPLHIDEIVRLSKDSPARTGAVLLELEMKKMVRQSPGKYFCRL